MPLAVRGLGKRPWGWGEGSGDWRLMGCQGGAAEGSGWGGWLLGDGGVGWPELALLILVGGFERGGSEAADLWIRLFLERRRGSAVDRRY